MSEDRPKRDTMSIEEATISNMWEIAAIVEVLERKGLCTKQDLYDIIAEFRRKNPRANIPETVFPEPYVLTETENKIIDDILALLNKHGLTLHQSQNLLERLDRIIEMGQRGVNGMTPMRRVSTIGELYLSDGTMLNFFRCPNFPPAPSSACEPTGYGNGITARRWFPPSPIQMYC